MLKICITGAAGQIAYSFIPLLLSGQVFGPDMRIDLRLLDIPPMVKVLQGVEMEIEDCAYPLLANLTIGVDPLVLFKEVDLIVFLGGFPRKPGMERKDLLQTNAKIFKEQGEALNQVGLEHTRCLVVANPANTNCMILSRFASKLPPQNFTCLTRLDQNRACSLIARELSQPVTAIRNVIVWGNHSTTQYPSIEHATINGEPVKLADPEAYIARIQKRGAEVLAARGNSSVFSAAQGVKDHLRDWYFGNEQSLVSMGVISHGEYGVPKGLCFSFPIRCKGKFAWEVAEGLEVTAKDRIAATVAELVGEQGEALGE